MMNCAALAQNSDPLKSTPLNESEKRLIWLQLTELDVARKKIRDHENWIKQEQELVDREKAVSVRELDNEKRATEIAYKERDIAKDQAQFYKDLYETVSKHRGCGFFGTLSRVFTLGAYRCK